VDSKRVDAYSKPDNMKTKRANEFARAANASFKQANAYFNSWEMRKSGFFMLNIKQMFKTNENRVLFSSGVVTNFRWLLVVVDLKNVKFDRSLL